MMGINFSAKDMCSALKQRKEKILSKSNKCTVLPERLWDLHHSSLQKLLKQVSVMNDESRGGPGQVEG